jgi:hypothetical protein
MASGKKEYSDIFDRPHHVSSKRPQMSRSNRAAQFSPFAALTGYDSLVAESARVTDQKVKLSDEEYEVLNKRLNYLQDHLSELPIIQVLYFEPDKKKSGGSYVEFSGTIRRVRQHEGLLLTTTSIEIPFESIAELSGDFFAPLDSLS